MKKKSYQVSDLFFNNWKDIPRAKTHADVYGLFILMLAMKPTQPEYGFHLIAILRALRKNPQLVDKINEAQAVDIFNDLVFLKDPWYHFPVRSVKCNPYELVAPEEHMSRHTFDHFIYADNEFSKSMVVDDEKERRQLLVRLVATIYRHPGETVFDRESVDQRAESIAKTITDWELSLITHTYAHIRSFITNRCKHLMPAPPKGAKDEALTVTGPMWQELKHRLAETPAFQGFKKASQANIYDCLDYLEGLAKQQARPNA